MRPVARVLATTFFAVLGLADGGHAAGPLIVNGAGAPLVWSGGVVPWNPDLGPLGAMSNAQAVNLVASNFARWEAVPSVALTIGDTGALPVDVTAENVGSYLGVCGDGLNPIVFDADGSITDALLGAGASNSVLGFAGPECGTLVPPVITEASAVLNGKFVDGIDAPNNRELSVAAFGAVFLHEFGHYLDLDHSQVNVAEAFDGNPGNDDAIVTMFPILINGTEAATLARDDQVAIATLYPAASFATAFGRITGRVLRNDGTTPFQGAYVIARNVADPRRNAIGCASGARYVPGAQGGPPDPDLEGFFELPGLTPGAKYTVEVEPIYPGFTGGSSVGPFSTPVVLPGPPEFWSGPNEAASTPPDDPAAPGSQVTAVAGTTANGIDIVLNTVEPPANDDCAAATVIDAFPFTDTVATAGATRAVDDPLLACAPSTATANPNTVWYRLTAPADGTVSLSTAGSDYDTVLFAYTGACGSLASVGCNDDDVGGDVHAALTFVVSAGTTYLIEAAKYQDPGGGTLHFTATFRAGTSGACALPAPGACIPGKGRPASECVTEWLVEPVPPVERASVPRRNVPLGRLVCHDGDPGCDFDAAGKDGGCTLHVAVCLNNADPRVAVKGCVPTSIASYVLQRPSAKRPKDAADAANGTALRAAVAALGTPAGTVSGGAISFAPPDDDANRCTPFLDIRVPIGLRVLRTRAVTASGAADSDQLTLRCLR